MTPEHAGVFSCLNYTFVGAVSETLSRIFTFLLGLPNLGFNVIIASKIFFLMDFCTESKRIQSLCVSYL